MMSAPPRNRPTIACLAVFGLLACTGLWAAAGGDDDLAQPPADVLDLNVRSFNIRWSGFDDPPPFDWPTRRPIVEQVIGHYAPDIIGFQENHEAQQSAVLDADLEDYSLFYLDPGQGGNKPIGYRDGRFLLDESGSTWISQGYGRGFDRAATWVRLVERDTGRGLYVYNVHYASAGPDRPRNLDESSQALIELITRRAHPDPFVLTGDFNCTEDSTAIKLLLGTVDPPPDLTTGANPNPVPLIDTYRKLHAKAADERTGSGFKGRTEGSRIDFIFVPNDAEVLEADIIRDNVDGVYPSDHSPVRAKVRLHYSAKAEEAPANP